MVVLSRIQFDEWMRQEMLLQKVRKDRTAQNAATGAVKSAGSPKAQSQFFMRRFSPLVGQMELQNA